MAVTRRGFLMFAGSIDPYAGPGKRTLADVPFPEDVTGEKKTPPVPVGAGGAGEFAMKCVGCFRCVNVCPQEILKPAAPPAVRPVLDFRYGWCRLECNACARACPAGAIGVFENAADKLRLRTGLARLHPERCVAATGKDICRACEKHCPAKAITLVAVAGAAKDAPKVPSVDASKCIGCGACEYYCPARPKAAVTVEGRA